MYVCEYVFTVVETPTWEYMIIQHPTSKLKTGITIHVANKSYCTPAMSTTKPLYLLTMLTRIILFATLTGTIRAQQECAEGQSKESCSDRDHDNPEDKPIKIRLGLE